VGVVEAITDLANSYPAGGTVVVTGILTRAEAQSQPSKGNC
jgi:hypothetical protein